MSQHYQDQFVPVDGPEGIEAADRAKKPRHKKFQTQSYGERMAAELDLPSTPGTDRSAERTPDAGTSGRDSCRPGGGSERIHRPPGQRAGRAPWRRPAGAGIPCRPDHPAAC